MNECMNSCVEMTLEGKKGYEQTISKSNFYYLKAKSMQLWKGLAVRVSCNCSTLPLSGHSYINILEKKQYPWWRSLLMDMSLPFPGLLTKEVAYQHQISLNTSNIDFKRQNIVEIMIKANNKKRKKRKTKRNNNGKSKKR